MQPVLNSDISELMTGSVPAKGKNKNRRPHNLLPFPSTHTIYVIEREEKKDSSPLDGVAVCVTQVNITSKASILLCKFLCYKKNRGEWVKASSWGTNTCQCVTQPRNLVKMYQKKECLFFPPLELEETTRVAATTPTQLVCVDENESRQTPWKLVDSKLTWFSSLVKRAQTLFKSSKFAWSFPVNPSSFPTVKSIIILLEIITGKITVLWQLASPYTREDRSLECVQTVFGT